MSIEVIKVIRDAEEKAEIIKKEASQKAKQIISDANSKASQILDEAENSAHSKSIEALKTAEAEGQLLYDDIIKQASDECDSLLEKSQGNMDKAANIIFERIVKTGGNS